MNQKFSFKDQLRGFALSHGLCGIFSTLDVRISHYDRTDDPAHPDFTTPCIWVFWHEYLMLPIAMWRGCDVTMLVSQHRDASWLSNAADRMGFLSVRGSTNTSGENKGGTEAIRKLRKMTNTCGIGITPDGPRGPRREMAMGPVYLASLLRLPLVATGFGYDRPRRMNSWDQFAVPRPGSRARIVMGERIHVPGKLKKDELEIYRRQIQDRIEEVTCTAEEWAVSGKRMREEMPFQRRPNRNWRDGSQLGARRKIAVPASPQSTEAVETTQRRAA